jgi:type II secretion system protein N
MILKRFLFYILILTCVVLITLISFWLNLSDKTLTPWLENQINNQLPRSYSIQIRMAETQVNGLNLDLITLSDTATNEPLVKVDTIHLKINPLRFLAFQEVDYLIELYEGSISGKLDLFPQRSTVFSFSGIQINRNAPIRKSGLILSNPLLSGKGMYSFGYPPQGQITLALNKISLSGKPEHTGLPFDFPITEFEWLKGGISFQNKDSEVQISSSGDLSANLEGTMTLNTKAPIQSPLNLILKAKLNPEYESKLGFFKDILVNYKNTAGQISVKISGNLNRPQVVRN